MENEDVIRQQMEETRTSLSEKLETLENEVTDTVRGATAAVSETVENIKESVQETASTVKETVQGTVNVVKDTVQQGAATVRDWFDIRGHVEAHPWLTMGGAVALGYWLETVTQRAVEGNGHQQALSRNGREGSPYDLPRREELHRERSPREESRAEARVEGTSRPSFWSKFAPELHKIKLLLVSYVTNQAQKAIASNVPSNMSDQVGEVFRGAVAKLVGEPALEQSFAGSSCVAHSRNGTDFSG